ncbi:MAG: selenocysteine-specific translation elongation factor [Dehalococcoidia bacterium]|nr:selenocysteine-specific translation elongation factor [Dehalococcoidia bacterium]
MPVIGTAGHVDHGKSTLVQALTGIDPDRLREEKERGLTIDLGFAWLTLPSGRDVGIVDVPGHERFIKNMLAGAGGVDLALLVVAADEGARPQTREHLAILDLLEVPAGLVVITKCDLVEPEYADLVEAELEETLEGSRLEGAPVVRVSAATGQGLEELTRQIDSLLDAAPAKRDLARGRLPIDRAFTIQGFGAVVTGTLIDGALEVGQDVVLLPGGLKARIRGLQRHRTKVDRLEPGTRAAVNLSGVHVDEIHRGMVLARPGAADVAHSLAVRLSASRILTHPLAHDSEVTALCATAESQARVRLLDAEVLSGGSECWAQLVLDSPIALAAGDHVVIRSPNETVAGGRAVLLNPRRLRRNHTPTIEMLERLLQGTPGSRMLDALLAGPADLRSLGAALHLEPGAADEACEELVARGDVLKRAETLVARAWLESAQSALVASVDAFLKANPLRRATPREHARGAVRQAAAAFDLIAESALEAGLLEARGPGLARPGYEAVLTAAQQAEVEIFLAGLRANPYSPPTDRIPSPGLLAFLVERGDVEDAGSGVVFEAGAFRQMAARTRAHIEANGSVSLAEARDLFGTSRKYAKAFLEHLDALHVTRRNGDLRTLR